MEVGSGVGVAVLGFADAPFLSTGYSVERPDGKFILVKVGITNYQNKKRIKQQEMQEQGRRQQAYRDWYYKKYGEYPTEQQFHDWYVKTYGVQPS